MAVQRWGGRSPESQIGASALTFTVENDGLTAYLRILGSTHAWKAAAKPVVKPDQPSFGFEAHVAGGFPRTVHWIGSLSVKSLRETGC